MFYYFHFVIIVVIVVVIEVVVVIVVVVLLLLFSSTCQAAGKLHCYSHTPQCGAVHRRDGCGQLAPVQVEQAI